MFFEVGMPAIHLIHEFMLADSAKVADLAITEELLTLCTHVNNKWRMYLIERRKEAKGTEKGKIRKMS